MDQESHDRNLELTLDCLKQKGLTLNGEKCLFSVPELVFFGFKISADGIKPDDKKVDAVKNARPPQNAAEVRSFLGLVSYCSRFIPNFVSLAEPLRRLTRSDVAWNWGEAEQDAFHRLRDALSSDCVVAHYKQSADTLLKVDASPVGLGAILLQDDNGTVRPVAYATSATSADPVLSQVKQCLSTGVWPGTPELLPYKRLKDELCVSTGVVLRGSRIVVPVTLQHETLCAAHWHCTHQTDDS
ncbi:Transposon Tf2-11 polyprotein [Exaiptasia diaphana]|nr:Transposon Tf2-11 polyprotein [Exaiptasia diaphana]